LARPALILPPRPPLIVEKPSAQILLGPGLALYSEARFERRHDLPAGSHRIVLEGPDDYAAFAPRVGDACFARFLEALHDGDPLAITAFRHIFGRRRRAGAAFSPYTDFATSGSGLWTAPAGAGHGALTSIGGGGGGDCATTSGNVRGGGGGAYCFDAAFAVTPGDHINYACGAQGVGAFGGGPGNGTPGGATSTSSGTGGFSGRAHSAGGGNGGTTAAVGAGGVASGGATTNTNGSAGGVGLSPSKGGDSGSGAAGGINDDGTAGPASGANYGAGGGAAKVSSGFAGGAGGLAYSGVSWTA